MKCQILFAGKNKKNISKCCMLKILPRVLSVKSYWWVLMRHFCAEMLNIVLCIPLLSQPLLSLTGKDS